MWFDNGENNESDAYANDGMVLAALAMVLGVPAQAQDYPNKPVTFITPAAAGNSPDVVTRIVADKLTQLWKQQIVIINRPGAGGLIAAQAILAALLPLATVRGLLAFGLGSGIVSVGLQSGIAFLGRHAERSASEVRA